MFGRRRPTWFWQDVCRSSFEWKYCQKIHVAGWFYLLIRATRRHFMADVLIVRRAGRSSRTQTTFFMHSENYYPSVVYAELLNSSAKVEIIAGFGRKRRARQLRRESCGRFAVWPSGGRATLSCWAAWCTRCRCTRRTTCTRRRRRRWRWPRKRSRSRGECLRRQNS